MQISLQEFEERYRAGTLRIALVGMSNIGKSYVATRLASQFDFDLIDVDKLIWEELGHTDMEAFAAWQGQPYGDGYEEREAHSIALEIKATQKALSVKGRNQILDTPGSVIYTGKNTLETLKNTHYIVYIKASEKTLERLKIEYFKRPKPLIWNGHFNQTEHQTNEEAILTSYPTLLKARSQDYEALADVTLSSEMIFDPKETIKTIYHALKPAVE